jgi:hypothetical protein
MPSSKPAVFNTVTSFTFDVFGTVVDWEQSVTEGLAAVYEREGGRGGAGAGAQARVGVEGAFCGIFGVCALVMMPVMM